MRDVTVLITWVAVVCGLPLLGVLATGVPAERYLEFPPRTLYIAHEPFSLPVFLFLAFAVVISLGALLYREPFRLRAVTGFAPSVALFGWILALGLSWLLAWTRFEFFENLQRHTFVLLWGCYIGMVAAAYRGLTGHSMSLRVLLHLAAASAAFWWMFEWLNRFVQNWVYHEVQTFTPIEYLIFATLSFSTVLPAIFSTALFLSQFLPSSGRLDLRSISGLRPVRSALLVGGAGSLILVGLFPNELFAFLWLAPLMLLIGMLSERQLQQSSVLSAPALWACAGVICGVLWELWNWKSLAGWEYAIPYVDRWDVFYMPILGYAGYVPFGVLCGLVAEIVSESVSRKTLRLEKTW